MVMFWAFLLWAQAGRAELFGTVQDPSGAVVKNLSVTAQQEGTNERFEVATDDHGEYHLLGLPAGQYRLIAGNHQESGITLRIGDQVRFDFQLGRATETVDVHGETSLLETASGSVSFHLDQRDIETLPLDGRNFIPLVALSPGVALPGGGSLLPRINGSRPRTNEYMYDGISVLQPEPGQVAFYPIIDAMSEFRLNINAYSPEYGRSNGGTVMVIGKSGSNDFHGTLFEFIRNEELNGRNFFAPAGQKPEFRRNQYGVVLGGPVRKNKTFFFVDWQGTRLRTGTTRQSVVPTLAQRNGVFGGTIYDPASSARVPFPNNTIPLNRFDPIAMQVLQHYPLPNAAGANNYVRTAVEPDNQDQFDGRLDHVFNDEHRAFVRYSYLRDNDTPVTFLPDGSGNITSGVIGHTITRGDGIASEYDWTISPTILNQARFGYTRRDVNQASLQNGGITVPGAPVEYVRVDAAYLFRYRLSADRANDRGQCEFHDVGDRVSGHAFDRTGPPHIQDGHGHPAGGARHHQSGKPDRLLRVHNDRDQFVFGRRRQRARFAAAGAGERVQHRHSEPGDSDRARISQSFFWAMNGRSRTG